MELFAAGILFFCAPVWADSAAQVLRYDVRAHGLRVGEVVTTRERVERPEGRFVRIRVAQRVHVSLLWLNVHRESDEEALLGPDGVVEFRRDALVDGRRVEVDALLRDGVFHFAIREDGVARAWEVPRADYDITSMDGFELQVKPGTLVTKRVLSLGELEIAERTFRGLPGQDLRAATASYACRVVELRDSRKQSRRWIVGDDLGMVIIRQDGRDKAGAYSMSLVARDAPAP